MHGGERQPCVVVDGYEQRLPACTIDRVAPVARDAVAGPHDAPELLGVDVQQVPGCLVLVAHDSLDGLQVAQLGQARSRQNSADRRLRDPHAACDASLQHSTFAQLDDEQRLDCTDAPWRAQGPGRGIGQGDLATGQLAIEPLPRCWRSDAVRGCCSHSIQAFQSHLLDHRESAGKGKSGMLMSVHPVGLPEWIECLATSSLSNPIRMNTGFNLFELDT